MLVTQDSKLELPRKQLNISTSAPQGGLFTFKDGEVNVKGSTIFCVYLCLQHIETIDFQSQKIKYLIELFIKALNQFSKNNYHFPSLSFSHSVFHTESRRFL